ncbi:MAG: cation-transporting P-type ATPase [Bryobacteraceae bacterium]|jgi:magnesium-transporting ATPase (P-type)
MSVQNETQAAAAANGLTSQEAEARLKQFGPNDPAPSKHHSAVLDFLRLFLNPLVLILLIAALVSRAMRVSIFWGIRPAAISA